MASNIFQGVMKNTQKKTIQDDKPGIMFMFVVFGLSAHTTFKCQDLSDLYMLVSSPQMSVETEVLFSKSSQEIFLTNLDISRDGYF